MKIDLHAHGFPERYLREIERLMGEGKFPVTAEPLKRWRLDEELAAMDATGIDAMAVSLIPATYVEDRALARELAAIANESFAGAARKYPERFAAFAFIPLGHMGDALAELKRCVETLGCRGLILGTTVLGKPLNHPDFLPVFEAIDRLRLPVLLHPMDPGVPAALREYRLDLWIGWPYETTLAVARLVLSGVFDRYPHFPLILSHLGGNVPQMLERIDMAARRGRAEHPPLDYFKRFYYDTAGPVPPEAVRAAAELFGVGQIVLGTDYPFGPGNGKVFTEKALHCVGALRASREEKALAYGGTARRLLGLPTRG